MLSPEEIVNKKMMANDAFSQWLGIEVIEAKLNYCKIRMTVRPEMTNGFGIAHGGISYSFADSALAFSSNSTGEQSVSIETSISHTKKIMVNDVLIAESILLSASSKTGIYDVKITNQKNEIVALFKGTVYRNGRMWE